MPIRNPFARRTAVDDDVRVGDATTAALPGTPGELPGKLPTFERVDTVGSMASSSLSIRSRKSQDTGEYKMSVVNDSGVYLPPSPPERETFWSATSVTTTRRYLSASSRTSVENSRTSLGDIEPFSISRESFDSYRRSFDISAKSPIVGPGEWGPGRQSLDSAAFRRPAERNQRQQPRLRSGASDLSQRFPPADEGFEDVGLDDGKAAQTQAQATPPLNTATAFIRKRGGFFSKFGNDHGEVSSDATSTANPGSATGGNSAASRFLLSTRKRAQSGQGSELTPMDQNTSRPSTATKTEPQAQEA